MTDSTEKSALTPAEQNPWYLLATLHGTGGIANPEIQNQNRVTWNRYYASLLTYEDRELLKGLISDKEMTQLNENEMLEIEDLYKKRSDIDPILPIKSRFSHFDRCEYLSEVNFSKYVFLNADFSGSVFCNLSTFSKAIFIGITKFNNCKFKNIVSFIKQIMDQAQNLIKQNSLIYPSPVA